MAETRKQTAYCLARLNNGFVGACPIVEFSVTRSTFELRKLAYLSVPGTQECILLAKTGSESAVHSGILGFPTQKSDWATLEIQQISESSYTWRFVSSVKPRGVCRSSSGARVHMPRFSSTGPGLNMMLAVARGFGRVTIVLQKRSSATLKTFPSNSTSIRLGRSRSLMKFTTL